jgi:hypothetical protein
MVHCLTLCYLLCSIALCCCLMWFISFALHCCYSLWCVAFALCYCCLLWFIIPRLALLIQASLPCVVIACCDSSLFTLHYCYLLR